MRKGLILALCATLAACTQLPASPDGGDLEALRKKPLGIAQEQKKPFVFEWELGASDAQISTLPGLTMLDVDGFEASRDTVQRLKGQGINMVCYLDIGSYEPGRPDSKDYPQYIKLQKDPNWAGEWFLDINDVFRENSVLAPILQKRMDMCVDKGFTWMEPDNMQNDENVRGKKITAKQQLEFNAWVADEAHKRGLLILQKNAPDKVLQSDSKGRRMVDLYDGILNEECQQYKECGPLAEYVKLGKPAINIEYKRNRALDCKLYDSLGVYAVKRDLGLKAPGMKGYVRQTCK